MHRTTGSAFVVAVVALALSACGGNVSESAPEGDGGAGGSAGGGGAGGVAGSGGSGGTGGVAGSGGSGGVAGSGGAGGVAGAGGSIPDACAVDADHPGPYGVTFKFSNYGAVDAYLLEECRLQYDVRACADDYQTPLAIEASCTIDCADTTGGCIACSPCMRSMYPIGLGVSHDDYWAGYGYTFDTTPQGCACHTQFVAPAGKYRIEVPVYDSADPYTAQLVRTSAVDFTLPAPDDTVYVDVSIVWAGD